MYMLDIYGCYTGTNKKSLYNTIQTTYMCRLNLFFQKKKKIQTTYKLKQNIDQNKIEKKVEIKGLILIVQNVLGLKWRQKQ